MEYIGSRRPILSISKNNIFLEQLLINTNSGIVTFDINQIESFILEVYKKWKKNKILEFNGYEEEIEKLSYKKITKRLVNVFNKIRK